MLTPKTQFISENEKIQYIAECEKEFDLQITECVNKITDNKNLKIIYVCGPSCSGKTTASNMIISKLYEKGRKLEVISVDDYYLNRDCIINNCLSKGVPVDFESVESLDFELLLKTISELSENKATIQVPCFDFKEGKRSGFRSINNSTDTLILFEGIQTIYPEISALFKGFVTFGVRIGIFDDISAGEKILSKNDLRLARRIVRDVVFRNTLPEETFALWKSVRDNEYVNIEPYIENTDISINSFHGYEISAMRSRIISHLESIRDDSIYRSKALELMSFISGFCDIDISLIPENSLLREFLI